MSAQHANATAAHTAAITALRTDHVKVMATVRKCLSPLRGSSHRDSTTATQATEASVERVLNKNKFGKTTHLMQHMIALIRLLELQKLISGRF